MSGCEGDLQFSRACYRILVEKLVKVPQSEEEKRSGIELFYLEVLPKHRRRVFHTGAGCEVRFRV